MKTIGSKQGFAWHVEQLRRAEGDLRRNKWDVASSAFLILFCCLFYLSIII